MMRLLMTAFGLFSAAAQADVWVAFFEKLDANHRLIQLENSRSRFFHVAIWIESCWLHTDAYRGVVCDREVPAAYGKLAAVLFHPQEKPNFHAARAVMGFRYDPLFNWADHSQLYCSELVGKLLHIPPQPMEFNPAYWPAGMKLPIGEPGLSPDKAYFYLRDQRHYLDLPRARLR